MCIQRNEFNNIKVGEHNREERKKIMRSISNSHEKIMETLNLFKCDADDYNLISDEVLNDIPFDIDFDSDGEKNIINTKKKSEIPGNHFISEMDPNSYVQPHKHETDKILKSLEGRFYDSFTGKWYKDGEYLLLKKGKEHDILSGNSGVKLLTFIMPKK